jgi:hypothetical protein
MASFGVLSKNTYRRERLEKFLDEHNFDPVEFMVKVAQADWKGLGLKSPTETVVLPDGSQIERDVIDLHIRVDCAKQIANYIYPKLRSAEIKGDAIRSPIVLNYETPTALEEAMANEPKHVDSEAV